MPPSGNFWADAPLLRKGALVVAFPLVAMALLAGAGAELLHRQGEARAAVVRTMEIRREARLSSVHASLSWAERNAWLRTRSARDNAEMRESYATARAHLARLAELVAADPEQTARVRAAVALTAGWDALLDADKPAPSRPEDETEDAGAELVRILEDLQQHERRNLDGQLEREARLARLAIGFLAGGFGVGAAGAVASLVLFARGIVRRVDAVGAYARARAEGGAAQLPPDMGRDEIGRLALQFRDAADLIQRRDADVDNLRLRLQSIIDNMETGLVVKDAAGRYVLVNKAFERESGWTLDQVRGKTIRDVYPPDIAEILERGDAAVPRPGGRSVEEVRMSSDLGAERVVLATRFFLPSPDGSGDELCIMGNDITERVLAAEGLRRAKEELEARVAERTRELERRVHERDAANRRLSEQLARMKLLNQIAKAIAGRHDLGSLFRIVLDHLRDYLSIDLGVMLYFEEKSDLLLVGARVHRPEWAAALPDLVPGGVSMLGSNGLRSCVSGKTIHIPDIVGYTAGGVIGDLAMAGFGAVVAAPLSVGEQTLGVLLAVRRQPGTFRSDDTEYLTHLGEFVAIAVAQLKLMDELQRAYKDLRDTQESMSRQERLRAMGQMASGIAHDINNALGPIAIYCDMMGSDARLPDDARRQVRIIQKASEGIARTVDNLRHFYRPAGGGGAAIPLDINEIVRSVVDLTRPRWKDIPQQKGVTIRMELDLAPGEPQFPGFEDEVRNALTNLIFNAVDAMEAGGAIAVRTREEDDCIVLEVADTGIGMDDRTKARLFEPFFTTKGERGTGLGLPMIYGIVKRHGATIDVDSEPGRGATFRIAFPRHSQPAPRAEEPSPTYLPNRHLRILSVDDDPMVRESVTALLRADGHNVRTAENGPDAIEACESASTDGTFFDVIITDLGMPGMDGRELAIKLKARWPSLPIILLTGWGSHLMEQAERMGEFVCVLAKPPRAAEVRAALRKACP